MSTGMPSLAEPEPQHQRDAEGARDDRGVAGRRATSEGEAGDELGTEAGDERGIEVVGEDHGRLPVAPVQDRRSTAGQRRDDAPRHVTDVGSAGAEVVVVDAGELVREPRGDTLQRVLRAGAVGDRGERRLDEPGIAREQRLGLEDRAHFGAGSFARAGRQRFQLLRGTIERRAQTLRLVVRRPGRRRAPQAVRAIGQRLIDGRCARPIRPPDGATRRSRPPDELDARVRGRVRVAHGDRFGGHRIVRRLRQRRRARR